jgi:soluble lytic murein transglycosylase
MSRKTTIGVLLAFITVVAVGGYFFLSSYWVHRFDDLIERHAKVYNLEERLVWSVIYEETYFRAGTKGAAEEIGLMQVTPTVAREWAQETGLREFEKETSQNLEAFLSDPERNIQVGCWYLERLRVAYRDLPAERAMMLAAYNAGASRVEAWTEGKNVRSMSEQDFIGLIEIPSTRAYVSSIIERIDSGS